VKVVQTVRDTEDRGELEDLFPVTGCEQEEEGVGPDPYLPAVGEGDETDCAAVGNVERQGPVGKDPLGGSGIVPLCTIKPTDIMEHAGAFEQETIMPGQLVQGLKAVEKHERKPCHGAVVLKTVRVGCSKGFTCRTGFLFPEGQGRNVPLLPPADKSLPELDPYSRPDEGLPVPHEVAVQQDPFPLPFLQEEPEACECRRIRSFL
jgi:hypothetical protein